MMTQIKKNNFWNEALGAAALAAAGPAPLLLGSLTGCAPPIQNNSYYFYYQAPKKKTEIVNPDLHRVLNKEALVEARDLARQRVHSGTKSEKIGGLPSAPLGLRINDRNQDGNIDHTDEFISKEGLPWGGTNEALNFLSQGCRELAPYPTYFTETVQAKKIREAHRVRILSDKHSKAEALVLEPESLLGQSLMIFSAGAYDPDLKACNFNRGAIHLEEGRNQNELKATFTDAMGPHVSYLNLETKDIQNMQ